MKYQLNQVRKCDFFRLKSKIQKQKILSEEILKEIRSSKEEKSRRVNYPFTFNYPESLPIIERREEVVKAIRDNQVLILAGETGSGKTTQIPKFCLEAGRGVEGKIGCTQPRRIAAVSVAQRIEEELQDSHIVGSKIRFQDKDFEKSFIKLMTDGVLLSETQSDPWLNAYDTLIIDEAHERSLNIDFLLGILRIII
ncbi:MAG: DEAD/DEAH box helicase [Spirochaetaceae bacterium]|jgi:ATP-dependent helicase HrpA|nr:DEAD/DEAH box helicase [Spirochaetaceae bacterium]